MQAKDTKQKSMYPKSPLLRKTTSVISTRLRIAAHNQTLYSSSLMPIPCADQTHANLTSFLCFNKLSSIKTSERCTLQY
jgi:hypothetical protein